MSVEHNKLIAEFMGGEYVEDTTQYKIHYYRFEVCPMQHITGRWTAPLEGLFYDCKWDWLMPVYQKIIQSDSVDHYTPYFRTFGTITDDKQFMVRLTTFAIHCGETLIEATYKAIVEYIEWYNEQSKA